MPKSIDLYWYKEVPSRPGIRAVLMVLDLFNKENKKLRYILLTNYSENRLRTVIELANNLPRLNQIHCEKSYIFGGIAYNRIEVLEDIPSNFKSLEHFKSPHEKNYVILVNHIVPGSDGRVRNFSDSALPEPVYHKK